MFLWFAGEMTNPGEGLYSIGEILSFEPQGHIDQADQDRHLH
jgi:hypothetical protein